MGRKKYEGPPSIFDVAAVTKLFQEKGIRESHLPRMYSFISKKPSTSLEDVPNMPRAFYELVQSGQLIKFMNKVVRTQRSEDGTVKSLLELHDGLKIESVIMSYDPSKSRTDGAGEVRATLCVSSQVGCQMGCTFCATGTMGLEGNLSSAEILEQLAIANQETRIRNVVFMGMGEPLSNYDHVKSAVLFMTDSRYFSLSPRRVTVSTVGVVPRIIKMAEDMPEVSLALSLHAPNQELREKIVPSAKAFKLDRLLAAVDQYMKATGNKIFIEYVVLHGVNDSEKEAEELGMLLKDRNVTLNLIPWNPVLASPGIVFSAPSDADVAAFRDITFLKYGVPTTIRQEKGQEISGACGQLVVKDALADIEDLAGTVSAVGGAGAEGGAVMGGVAVQGLAARKGESGECQC